ncbi:MAG: glycosyltransferase family 4 protein [Candidatus Eisenbacteria bacterium]|uniref:Glycosyltransferase family 4 protein n=1 Tax=Eiseniibacteriota bacterium TaxID=2212470 RepID=A0A849SLB2_UNCEI|nr:glycosyltransferase family 4 protein [Candidatus Eisenbacteria bacterium]
MNGAKRPVRVLHIITRMIVGGAQENTMLSCALIDRERFPSVLLCGPETGSEGELHTETRARGVTMHLEPHLVRAPHPFKDLSVIARLARFIREQAFDVVHTHSSKAGIVGRIAARRAGVRAVVHTVHGWGFHPRQNPLERELYQRLERWCASMCRSIVVVAEADREEGLELGIGRAEQYVTIRSGIEIEAFRDVAIAREEIRARLGLDLDAFVIGCVGRLSPQKSPLDLFAAFTRVAAARPDAHLVYVGDGPHRAALEAAAARASLEHRVHLLGLRRDVPELLRAFDVFALSSRWEGLPRVFPQAMAAGLPIVATRVDGAPDAIVSGETGWLVEVGDASGMAARLIEIANDPTKAKRMGAAGRARVDEFSSTRMVAQLEQLYERLTAADDRA